MKYRTILLTATFFGLIGFFVGAGITKHRMGIEYRYHDMTLNKLHCFKVLREIRELESLDTNKVRNSLERDLVLNIFFAEQAAGINNKVGNEARELLKMVSHHRNSPQYIKAENEFKSRSVSK